MSKQRSAVFVPIVPIDKASAVPLHKQLYQNYRQAILSGQLRAGTKVPSTRELASHFEVARNTVMAAFEQLLADGFLAGKVGSGTFITYQGSNGHQGAGPRPQSNRSQAATPALSRVSDLLTKNREPAFLDGVGPFRASVPALDAFPWSTWSRLVTLCTRQHTREQLAYSGPMGLQSFREEVASYLRAARNVRCEAEQVLVVSGSQQALCVTAQALLERGESVWLEEPGYMGARCAFLLSDLEIGAVPVDAEGLNVQQGRELFPNARLAYVTPSHQFPLGMTMSLRRRLELLDWAATHNSWIIEDDYDSEYRYVSKPISSLQGLDEQDRVIYVGTFSKVLFPSLRIGYMVVPPSLVDRFAAVREAFDVFPPVLLQMVVTEFIRQGHFGRHICRMRSIYSERLNEVLNGVKRELAGRAHVDIAESGMHVVVFPSEDIDDMRLCKEAARQGVIAMPLSTYYCGAARRHGLILGFGGTDLTQIRRGMVLLKRAFEAVSKA